jgi:NAD(P)-dependent dehydrogenase (short-subunit alcohol dehydrogenase family)
MRTIRQRFSLAGKTALVTGGAGLYGRQIVDALAEAGARTIMASAQFGSPATVGDRTDGKSRDWK